MRSYKHSAPEFAIDLVDRPSLLKRLEAGRSGRLVLIQAPAGYGKTTLLAQWQRHLASQGIGTVWLTLDEHDRRPENFLDSLELAISGATVASDVTTSADAPSGVARQAAAVLAPLAGKAAPTVLILDDYHRAQTAETEEILDAVINCSPPNLHIVVASRVHPALSLAALRARGQLSEINCAALAFSLHEAQVLFGAALPPDDLSLLYHRLQGWPVALQLARIWLGECRTGGDVDNLLTLSHHDIANFLTTQVLSGLSQEALDVLTATSIVEEFNSDLARTLTGLADVSPIFDELARLGGLVTPIRMAEHRYACHQLLRDFLSERLALTGDDNLRRLHRRAAQWFLQSGDVVSAVRHAVMAGDMEVAAEMIQAAGAVRIGLMSGLPMLSRLMAMLPLRTVYRFPRLQIARAWMLAKGGALEEGRACYANVRPALEGLPAADPARHEGLFVDMMLSAVYEDDARALTSVSEIESLATEVSQLDHWFQGWINNLLTIIHTRRGALTNASEAAMTAMRHYQTAGSSYGQLFMQLHVAIIATLSGRLSEAQDALDKASLQAESGFPADRALSGLIRVVKAQILYERNNLEDAEMLLDGALLDIQHAEGWVEIYVRGFQTRSAIAYQREGLDQALVHLETARAVGVARHLPRLIWLSDCLQTELLTLHGCYDEAADYASRCNAFLERAAPSFISWRERKRATIAKARLAIHCGDAEGALPVLQKFRIDSERHGRDRAVMEISLMEALAAEAVCDRDRATAALKRALAVAVPERFLRSFASEGPLMAKLLRNIIRHLGVANMPTAMVTFIAEVLTAIGQGSDAEGKQAAGILSAREVDVLRHLALGHANKVIARSLDLTEATVKFHLANIYRKLGVRSRVLAVAVAREKRILVAEDGRWNPLQPEASASSISCR